MTVDSLMTESVTLLALTGETRDEIGGSVRTETTTTTTAYLEPRSGSEDEADRNTEMGDWLAFLPADVALTGWDRLMHGTRVFDVVAPPRPVYNPRVSAVSHVEVDLREVT